MGYWGAAFKAFAQNLPSIAINIHPLFNGSIVTYLNTTLHITDSTIISNETFLQFQYGAHLTPTQRYDGNSLSATDASGSLPISYTDSPDGLRQWVCERAPVGKIVVQFMAEPRGDVAGVAGRNDLRANQGGVIGQGYSFLPYPPGQNQWNTTVSWTIREDVPDGTRFASSLGDSDDQSAVGRPNQLIHSLYFAVGRLQRWPAWDIGENSKGPTSNNERQFSMYWIGELPWNSTALASTTQKLYEGTANYFNDHESDFRVFYRHDYTAFGGAGGYKSFLMEYAEGSEEENPELAIENLISHEIVHGFAITSPYTDLDKWYVEGVAECLSTIGPFIGGSLGRETFVRWLNDNAQDYYTASPLGRTWESLITNYWTQGTQ